MRSFLKYLPSKFLVCYFPVFNHSLFFLACKSLLVQRKQILISTDCCNSWIVIIIWSHRKTFRQERRIAIEIGRASHSSVTKVSYPLRAAYAAPSCSFPSMSSPSALHQSAWLHAPQMNGLQKLIQQKNKYLGFFLCWAVFHLDQFPQSGSPSSCTNRYVSTAAGRTEEHNQLGATSAQTANELEPVH